MKQRHQQRKHQRINASGKQKAFIATLVAGSILVVLNIAMLLISLSPFSQSLDKQFIMRPGESITVKQIEKKNLSLVKIKDGRCPTDEDILCDWEGQIYYEFSFDGKEFMLGSVLEEDQSHILGNGIQLVFIDGDLESGTFILRKTTE